MYHPPDFVRAFRNKEIFKKHVYPLEREVTLQIEVVGLGELLLPTGKIVAFDPSYDSFDVFETAVSPGRYQVWLSVAHFDDEIKNTGVASAMLKFREQEAVEWKIATISTQNNDISLEEEFYCYGVDAGLGCFADEKAASHLAEKLSVRDNYTNFLDELNKNSVVPYHQCMNMLLDSKTGLNICVFHSGYGDGCYPSFWGLGSDGTTVCLVTDFMLGNVDDDDIE